MILLYLFLFQYSIFLLTVTLDYKGLVLLLAKPEDDDFELGGRGFNVEFCILCQAIRERNNINY
jgi:hypothetical protein